MKHLLNNMTEEEKNSIREQYSDKLKVVTESFRKLVGSKLGDVKPINEQNNEFLDGQVKNFETQGYKVVPKFELADGEYNIEGAGYVCYIMKDGKDSGFVYVTTGGIRGMWDGKKVKVVGGQIPKLEYGEVYKILYKPVAPVPTSGTTQN